MLLSVCAPEIDMIFSIHESYPAGVGVSANVIGNKAFTVSEGATSPLIFGSM